MDRRWLVLGGWALPPEILAPVFGPGAVYVDVNSLLPSVVSSGGLAPDWRASVAGSIRGRALPPVDRIAGWSTGAIVAAGICGLLGAKQAALLSVTPSFCQRTGFDDGWPPRLLQRLHSRLRADPQRALADFYRQCGIPASCPISRVYDSACLQAGLVFLRDVSLLPLSSLPAPCVVLHGMHDRIVPAQSAKRFAEAVGGRFVAFAGGHAFFLENPGDVWREICAAG